YLFGYTKDKLVSKLKALNGPGFICHQLVKMCFVVGDHALFSSSQALCWKRNEQVVSVDGIKQSQASGFVYLFEARYGLEDESQVNLMGRAFLYYILCLCKSVNVDDGHKFV